MNINEELITDLRRMSGDYGKKMRGELEPDVTYSWDGGEITAWEAADALEAALQTRPIEPMEADELEAIRDALMIDLTKTGYDLSGTDHSYENEIEVGTNEHEFRITIGGL